MSTTMPPQRRRGRRPASPEGRRDRRAETRLTDGERARHEAWLCSKGWPGVSEADIVREALAEAWQRAGITSTAA